MNKKIDRYIFLRLLAVTLFVMAVLVFIFIIIDFSEHSEDFADKGATFAQIFGVYYLNYIPEMTRLIVPVAVFVSCLYLTGQMAQRLEITALKAAGVSLYQLFIPYFIFAICMGAAFSYLDGFVIPKANKKRIAFGSKYLPGKYHSSDSQRIFRQLSNKNILKINYFNEDKQIGYHANLIHFNGDSIQRIMSISKMIWKKKTKRWKLQRIDKRIYTPLGYEESHIDSVDTTLSVYPRDLVRKTSDIYQLTYPEAQNYIGAIQRSGAGEATGPEVKLYGRYAYPFSIIVLTIIGFAIASVRREGGKGFYIAAGLVVSFLYLVLQKIIEPFGGKGEIAPLLAALLPHIIFFITGLAALIFSRK